MAVVLMVLVLRAVCVRADTWAAPIEEDYTSANGRFVAHVTPASTTSKALLQVYEIKHDRRAPLWKCELGNEGAPQQVFLTDDGAHVVTVNDCSRRIHGALGDYVLAFYRRDGVVRHYSLEQLLHDPSPQELDRLAVRTVSGRYWACTMFLRQFHGRWVFSVWPDRGHQWLAWNAQSGEEVEVTGPLSSFLDGTARRWAAEEGLAPGKRQGYGWCTAIQILQRLKRPEDRKLIEPLLQAQDFETSNALDIQAFRSYLACSPRRNAAERALAAWGGSGSGDINAAPPDLYCCLGVVRGTLCLPRPPTAEEESWLCVYLVPASCKPDTWYEEVPVHRLCLYLSKYSLPAQHGLTGTSIPFTLAGVSPGLYNVKAVWDLSSPYTLSADRISGPPSQGDYENQQCPLIRVEAGRVLKGLNVDCTCAVADHSVTMWSRVQAPGEVFRSPGGEGIGEMKAERAGQDRRVASGQ